MRQQDTQWRIVYDLENLQIYFKTLRHPEIKARQLDATGAAKSVNRELARINANKY